MNKPILYSDFDGVIYDTISVAIDMMREHIDVDNRKERDYYFRYLLDWNELYRKAEIINDATRKLLYFKDSNIFSDVVILSKLCGNYDEEKLKRDFLREVLPQIKLITMQYDLHKTSIVNPKGNILIDDEKRNCLEWNNHDGIAVLFRKDIIDLENNIVNDLTDITNTNGVKRLIKKL